MDSVFILLPLPQVFPHPQVRPFLQLQAPQVCPVSPPEGKLTLQSYYDKEKLLAVIYTANNIMYRCVSSVILCLWVLYKTMKEHINSPRPIRKFLPLFLVSYIPSCANFAVREINYNFYRTSTSSDPPSFLGVVS